MRKVIKKNQGFTLIELLVVIAIISLLSSVILGSVSAARANARDAKRYADVHEMDKAIQLYILANGHAPDFGGTCSASNPQNYSTCFTVDTNTPNANWTLLQNDLKPYLPVVPKDPCGSTCLGASGTTFFEYRYVTPAEMADYCTVNTCPSDITSSYQVYAMNFERASGSFGVATFGPFGVPLSVGSGSGRGIVGNGY